MLYELLLFGDPFFWVAVLVFFALETALVENEKAFGATVVLILSLGAFTLFTDFNVFSWLHGLELTYLIALFFAYFVIGTGWFVFKWYLFLIDRKEEADLIKEEYSKLDTKKADLKTYIKRDSRYHARSVPPKVRDHKEEIMLWACYWPFSLAWTVCGDFLARVWRRIYTVLSTFLQKMSDNVFKGVI